MRKDTIARAAVQVARGGFRFGLGVGLAAVGAAGVAWVNGACAGMTQLSPAFMSYVTIQG